MAKFHSLKVADVRRETEDAVSIAFAVPEDLIQDYQFQPGQYLTLKMSIDGEEVRRSYSICAAPDDYDLRVAIKKVPLGKFSTFANEVLHVGQSMDVMTPMGSFTTVVDSKAEKNYVAFAAGSGITPIMSIMKSVLRNEPNSTFTLFYGNKGVSSIIFREDIEDLKNTYPTRFSVFHILSREHQGTDLFFGRMDEERCSVFLEKLINVEASDEFFLCGPEEMILNVQGLLKDRGVPKERIHFELFNTSSSAGQQGGITMRSTKSELEADTSTLTVQIDGDRSTFQLASKGQNILDAALEQGMDAPFACKGAVCMTCRAKLIKGDARMDLNYALTDQEVEDGYVLTCQAHPTSAEVEVSFDD